MKTFFIFYIIFFLIGCTETPENHSINKKYDIIEKKVEDEINGICGNGILEAEEGCDFSGVISCSIIDASRIGPMKCVNCRLYTGNCVDKDTCRDNLCSGNGTCYEDELDFHVGCKCDSYATVEDCSECIDSYHFDLDGTCISNRWCTKIGCEYEHSKCQINEGQASCVCIEPWTGNRCDQCNDDYYLENGECKGKYCTNTDVECTEYEKCDDSTGQPQCICSGLNQDPEDCSKCLPDYDWIAKSCRNQRVVSCTPNPDRPENSDNIEEYVAITYTDETGWSEPELCGWECSENTYEKDDKCIKIKKYEADSTLFPIGINSEGLILAGNKDRKQIFFMDEEGIVKTVTTDFYLTDGRISRDGNIYFRTSSTYGIFDPETENGVAFSYPETTNAVMTLKSNGDIFFGNTVFSFPEISQIESGDSSISSVSVTNSEGRIFTVFENGFIVSSKQDGDILWEKTFTDLNFSSYPAIDNSGLLYLPYSDSSTSEFGILIINPVNGEKIKTLANLYDSGYIVDPPAISIGTNGFKYIVSNGILRIFDNEDQLTHDTSSVLNTSNGYSDIPPVITDTGLVLFTNQSSVICLNILDEILWTFETTYPPKHLLYTENLLYVFTASKKTFALNTSGKLSGDWPHPLYSPQLSGNVQKIQESEKPEAAIPVLPADNHEQYPGNVIFTWDIPENPDLSYTLVIKDSTGIDKVFAGPEKGLDNYSVNLVAGQYLWHVISQSPDGAIKISANQSFTIKEE